MADIILPARRHSGRDRRGWLELIAVASLLVHATLLAIIYFAKRLPHAAAVVPDAPGFAVVWDQGQKRPDAVTAPGRFIKIPNGERVPNATPAPQAKANPQSQAAQPAPEVNLFPWEQQVPPPQTQQTSPDKAPRPAPKVAHAQKRPRTAPQANPFAHPMDLSFASVARPAARTGLHGSKSLDLSMGLQIEGGQLKEAIPHASNPGAEGDYLELLSEYVETHKFYPEGAAANREDGVSVIKVTIARDGQVEDVHLVESSGSRDLDLAWLGLFRDKRLPPFPEDIKGARKDFTLSMDYELIYR